MDEKLIFTIDIFASKRMEQGFLKTRYTAMQHVDGSYIAADSFDSPEDAIARLSVAAAKRGGFIK